ncbi:hypothetical protein [Halobacillus karajensis]|uniref:hypothetical protein n=1 Tax=Halobacillus karajensis TaxID=195088 RepID=UPI00045CFB36|nr:hypothetical protein [Halobacillus karajensis]CDQ17935.1 hypothetical protein BN982_00175 [Halobacillus karajensis]
MKEWQVYVNVDEEGFIILQYSGKHIVATDDFDFFFLTDEETIANLEDYKVQLDGYKPSLVLKENAV